MRYLLLTKGEAGMDASTPERTRELREAEQVAGSRAVGVSSVDFLDYPDGVLEYGLDLRRDIARAIRAFRPDAVVVGSWEVEFMAGLNQADHRAAGLAAVDAVRDAGNRGCSPSCRRRAWSRGRPGGCSWAATPGPTHGVDVTGEPLERGIASLEAHKRVPGRDPRPTRRPAVLITAITRMQGEAMGAAERRPLPGLGLPRRRPGSWSRRCRS